MQAKSKLASFETAATPKVKWSFAMNGAIFERLNRYLRRLRSLRDIFRTANEFAKLDRIEMGGLRGRQLSQRLTDVGMDYQRLYNNWTRIDFDVLDAMDGSGKFETFRRSYQEKADSLERALAQLLVEAFNDCQTVEHCIKVNGTSLTTKAINQMNNAYTFS